MAMLRAVVLTVGLICLNVESSVLKTRRSFSILLDTYNTQSLDTEVRKQMLLDIVERADQSVILQDKMELECETTINRTIDQCNACAKRSCGSSAPASQSSRNVWQTVLPVLMDPSVRTGLLVTGIEKTAGRAVGLLGKESGKLISGLKKLGKDIGKTLSKGSKDVINNIGNKFKNFGKDLAKLADMAKNGLKDLGNQINKGANAVGNTFKNAGKSIASGFKSLFGKRSNDCTSRCPSCTKLDTESQNSEQILTNVCGADYLQKQQTIIDETTRMSKLYEWAVDNTVIEKVEYNPTSMDPTQGVVFTEAYITINIEGKQKRFRSTKLMRLTDIPTWSKDLANEIWEM